MTEPRYHSLKTWPEPFRAMADGTKTFELRKDDRGYMVGDVLHLREWDPGLYEESRSPQTELPISYREEQAYTGRDLFLRVTYVLHGGRFGLPEGYVVMSVVPQGEEEP